MDVQPSRDETQRLALSRAAAVAGITATFAFPLAFYARSVVPSPVNVPLIGSDARGYYVVALLAVIILAAIIHALDVDDPARIENRYGERVYLYRQPAPRTAWMLPAVILGTTVLLFVHSQRLVLVILLPLAAAVAVFAARAVRLHVMNRALPYAAYAGVALQVLTYLTAFVALAALYGFKMRSLYSAPLAFVVGFLLLMQLTDGLSASAGRRILFATVGGLAVAELIWALNYWNTSMWIGGALLAVVFFFFASVARAHLAGGLSIRQLIERGAVAAPLFIILAYLAE